MTNAKLQSILVFGIRHSELTPALSRLIKAFLHGDFDFLRQAEFLPHLLFDGLEDGRVVLQELLDVLAALAEALAAEREPGAALLDDLPIDGKIEQVPFARDAFA